MPITPLDIEEKEFRSSLFGYHRGEVDTFLAELGEELQRLIKENHALKDELKRKEERLARLDALRGIRWDARQGTIVFKR